MTFEGGHQTERNRDQKTRGEKEDQEPQPGGSSDE